MAARTASDAPKPAVVRTRAQRGRRGAPHGDTTGRKREALQREHETEIKEREGEITTISHERQRSVDEDVVDITDPQRPVVERHGAPAGEAPVDDEEDDGPEETNVSGYNSKVDVFRIEEPEPKPGARREVIRNDPDWLNEPVTFRVNTDLDDVTIGQGNNFTFEEGRQYRAPRWIFLHLEEKGCVWH